MKRVGLLETDVLSPAVLRHFPNFLKVFQVYFSDQPEMEFISYEIFKKNFPVSPSACDAWIIPGSSLSVYDQQEWTLQMEDFVRSSVRENVPTLGICYGHQFLAQAFGGKVEKAQIGRGVGVHSYTLTTEGKKEFAGKNEITLPVAHQDQVVLAPPGTVLLASSNFCPIAALKYSEGPAMSIQGHPEFTIEVAGSIAEDWEEIAPLRNGTLEKAQKSLSLPVDTSYIRPALARFLTG